jgi:hypothetical protein
MRLSSNKRDIRGEINMVDRHDYFDIPGNHDQLDTQIGIDGNFSDR